MRKSFALVGAVVCVLFLFGTIGAAAEGGGQEDLDRAMKAKLAARSFDDLAEVIQLCESALKKGLDGDSKTFANQILSATLIQRGSLTARRVLENAAAVPPGLRLREKALADLQRGVAIDVKQPEAHLFIARLHLLPPGDLAAARKALDQAVKTAEESPELRAKSLVLRGELAADPKQKRADLEEARRVAPRDSGVVLAHGLLLADLGDAEGALKALDRAIQLNPDNSPAYEAKGIVLARQKKYDEALVALDRARELEPNSIIPLVQQARIHMLQRNPAAALQRLDLAAAIDPDDVELLLLRSGIYQETDQSDKALADVDRVLRSHPALPSAVRLRTLILAGQGKLAEAVAGLEKLRQKNPKDTATLLQLAMVHSAAGEHAKAVECYTALLALRPNDFLALRNRGDSRLGVGQHAEAIADYEQAFKVDPADPGLLNNFAWVLATSPYEKVRNGKRAIQLATDACRRTQFQQAHILSTLAASYAETGDFTTALHWSEKALRLGDESQKEPLSKELASYKARKPWRELQTGKEDKEKAKPPTKPKATTPDKSTPPVKKPLP